MEREMFRFIVPEIEYFRKGINVMSPHESNFSAQLSPAGDEEGKEVDPELCFKERMDENVLKSDSEVTNNIPVDVRDSLASRQSDYQSEYDNFDSPYLFKKHMQREKLVFETLSLV